MSRKAEILAPAGGREQLLAALGTGADAVYLGAGGFNARRNAQNFDQSQLEDVVKYCHERGVRVYLAMNTLVRDDEFLSALELFKFACRVNIDAVIVQDIGLVREMKKIAPQMPLHASTQMTIHTPSGARFLEKMGFSRVILSRELSKKAIEEIAESCNLEIEVFVHGALCMSVSGQCLFSAVLGSRSGNRGACAQPCRLPFKGKNTDYALSLKDLSLINNIGQLTQIGVTSLKIEGRMKRPEYVAGAVSACRMARDEGAVSPEMLENLEAVFSRSGFTDGYFKGVNMRGAGEMFGVRRREDVMGATSKVLKSLENLYHKELQRVEVDFTLILDSEKSILKVKDDDGNTAVVQGEPPQVPINAPLDEPRAVRQISKTGGTPYKFRSLSLENPENLTMPAASINEIRRQALEILSSERVRRNPIEISEDIIKKPKQYTNQGAPLLRAVFKNTDSIPEKAKVCEKVFIPVDSPEDTMKSLIDSGFKIGAELPRTAFEDEENLIKLLKCVKNIGVCDVLVHNLGQVEIVKNAGMKIHFGFSMNIMNSHAIELAEDLGAESAEISFELSVKQARSLGGSLPRAVLCYGKIPLMLTRNCPASAGGENCKQCGGQAQLLDRKGETLEVMCSRTSSEIFNPIPLSMLDRLSELSFAQYHVLRFSTESEEEVEKVFDCYTQKINRFERYTRGLYYRGVE